jgi:hypothetical protein
MRKQQHLLNELIFMRDHASSSNHSILRLFDDAIWCVVWICNDDRFLGLCCSERNNDEGKNREDAELHFASIPVFPVFKFWILWWYAGEGGRESSFPLSRAAARTAKRGSLSSRAQRYASTFPFVFANDHKVMSDS